MIEIKTLDIFIYSVALISFCGCFGLLISIYGKNKLYSYINHPNRLHVIHLAGSDLFIDLEQVNTIEYNTHDPAIYINGGKRIGDAEGRNIDEFRRFTTAYTEYIRCK